MDMQTQQGTTFGPRRAMGVSRTHKTVDVLVLVVAVAAIVSGAIFVSSFYAGESRKRGSGIVVKSADTPDHLLVEATLTGVDTTKGEVSFRVEFTPRGSVSEDGDEIAPASNIVVLIPGASNKQEIVFEAGRLMGAQELTIGFSEGLPTRYPFDEYKARLTMLAAASAAPPPAASSAASSESAESGGASESTSPEAGSLEGELPEGAEAPAADQAQGSTEAEPKVIPLEVAIFATLPTVDVEVEAGTDASDPEVAIADLALKRSPTVVGFAVFAMIAMWAIAIVVGVQAWAIASRGRVPEPDIMSYMAALLFAFPVLRDALPGTPPVGTLSDFLAFFWAEAIVAVALIVTLISWLVARRLGRMEG